MSSSFTKSCGEKSLGKFKFCNVSYLNSVPYQHATSLNWIDYSSCEPSRCAALLLEEEVDAALIPVVELANYGSYEVLPFGIASSGDVQSVILGAEVPWGEVDNIYVDGASKTSVILLRLLLNDIFGERADSIKLQRRPANEVASRIGGNNAGLLIGNIALKERDNFKFILDLASCWRETRGLPFVFAVWAIREGSLKGEQKLELVDAISTGVKQRTVYARKWAEDNAGNKAMCEAYVNGPIEYSLSDAHRRGLMKFLGEADAANLLPALTEKMCSNLSSAISQTDNSTLPCLDQERTDFLLTASTFESKRLNVQDATLLAEEATLADLLLAADSVCRKKFGKGEVSYVLGKDISYVDSEEATSSTLAGGEGLYTLSRQVIASKIEAAQAKGSLEISLRGGLQPDLGIDYYENLFSWVKSKYPVDLQGTSASEVVRLAEASELSVEETLERLMIAGIVSLSGEDAYLLVGRLRNSRFESVLSSEEWVSVHRRAHQVGLKTNCSIAYGVGESWRQRIVHLQKLRELQDETGGFTSFEVIPYRQNAVVAENYLRLVAISRLYLDNFKHIASGWQHVGPALGQLALLAGANDFGVISPDTTTRDERVVRLMGVHHAQRCIREAGRASARRNSRFERIGPIC